MNQPKPIEFIDIGRVLDGPIDSNTKRPKGPRSHVELYDEVQGEDLYRGRAELGDVETCLLMAVLSAFPERPRRAAVAHVFEEMTARVTSRSLTNSMLKRSIERGYLVAHMIRDRAPRGKDVRETLAYEVTDLGLRALRSSMARFVRVMVMMDTRILVRSWLRPDWRMNYPDISALIEQSAVPLPPVRRLRPGRPAGIVPGMTVKSGPVPE